MTSVTVARNVSQRAGTIFRVFARIINANIGIYTVPTGKSARITNMLLTVNALGVDARYGLAFKRGSIFKAISIQVGNISPENKSSASAIVLQAGDILTDIGNNGATNGTVDIAATVEEFSV